MGGEENTIFLPHCGLSGQRQAITGLGQGLLGKLYLDISFKLGYCIKLAWVFLVPVFYLSTVFIDKPPLATSFVIL